MLKKSVFLHKIIVPGLQKIMSNKQVKNKQTLQIEHLLLFWGNFKGVMKPVFDVSSIKFFLEF